MSETSATFTDRSFRLKVMGIIQIILGGITAVFVLVMVLAFFIVRITQTRAAIDARGFLFGGILYSLATIFFIWSGIASIRCLRYARPIVLSLAVPGLVVGIMAFGFYSYFTPQLINTMMARSPHITEGIARIVHYAILGITFFIYIVLPGAHVLVYLPKDVERTCRSRDTRERWTDRVPVPVLGVAVWLAITALFVLLSLPYMLYPFFGILITGVPAIGIILLMAAVSGILSYAVYTLKPWGWWGTVLFILFVTLSVVVSFSRIPLVDYYRAAGMPEEQLGLIADFAAPMKLIIFMSAIYGIGACGYMVYIRKYFTRQR